jgi:hypothetical protein
MFHKTHCELSALWRVLLQAYDLPQYNNESNIQPAMPLPDGAESPRASPKGRELHHEGKQTMVLTEKQKAQGRVF